MGALKKFFIGFGVKAAILGGTVYYTMEKGVWDDSNRTCELYKELQDGMSPYVGELKKKIPFEAPALPGSNRIEFFAKYYWNQGVKMTFNFLVNLPTHTMNAANRTYNFISASIDQATKSDETIKN